MEHVASGGQPDFENRNVYIWAVQLDASESDLTKCSFWLSPDENARAARFHFEEHRREFVLSHALLRALLGSYLGEQPANINFSYGPKGKPALKDAADRVCFNMSHSGNLALYGFTRGCELGVDVERVRTVPDTGCVRLLTSRAVTGPCVSGAHFDHGSLIERRFVLSPNRNDEPSHLGRSRSLLTDENNQGASGGGQRENLTEVSVESVTTRDSPAA
jgi:4'-phosphopantetheinyl transferase, N-terminal